MSGKNSTINPNPRRGIEVRDQEAIKARIIEINKQREAWWRKERKRHMLSGRKCKLTQSYITHNLDDLWRDYGVCDLESFERVAKFL